jgi:ABC-2 type transport system ATP-binding protein
MEAVFRDEVAKLRAQGRTVLLSSHILGEVEAVSDRVSIIRDGRRVDSGSLADLRHLTRTAVSAELSTSAVGLDRLPGVHALETDGLRVSCQVEADHLEGLLRALTDAGVRTLSSQPPTLEELFLRHYRSQGDDES